MDEFMSGDFDSSGTDSTEIVSPGTKSKSKSNKKKGKLNNGNAKNPR